MSGFLDAPCRHCGESARRLLLKAMLQDMGVQCSSGADKCWAREDGGEHDFTEEKENAK